MFGVFTTTFIYCFPRSRIEVQPENDWYAILVVTVFNVNAGAGDVIGRFGSSSSDKAIKLSCLWGTISSRNDTTSFHGIRATVDYTAIKYD